jgi:Flp pilus assembly protein TadD
MASVRRTNCLGLVPIYEEANPANPAIADKQGEYEDAEAMHRQTLQLTETVLGKDHPDTLTSMNNLAVSLRLQGKCAEAEAMHKRAL